MLFIEAEHAVIHSCALTFMKHLALLHCGTLALLPYSTSGVKIKTFHFS